MRMFRTLPRHEEDGLGLPYPVVLIDSAEEEIDDATGEPVGISVPDMEGLVASVAIARAMHPMQLDGTEVRFMRRAIGMTAADFAGALDMDPATLSRWENNRQTVGGWADKTVRSFAVLTLRERVPGVTVDADALIRMRLLARADGVWPKIELRRVDRAPAPQATSTWGASKLAA
jgi:DNA-binding transcriptional regulator YiaG